MAQRKKNQKALWIGITACFSFCVQICFSQTVQTFTDRKDILIGEHIKLKIKATFSPGQFNLKKWAALPDSIPHFDIVEIGKVDTTDAGNAKAVEQSITLTSFDSGAWVFPSLPVEFSDVTGQPILKTDSILINVSYSPADSTNQLRDIKPIIPVDVTDYTWHYIAGGIVLLLIIIALLYRYFKKKKKLKPEGLSSSKLSAYDEAMDEIKKLPKYNLQHADELKAYHTKLSDIFKVYFGRKQGKSFANKTTGDILISMAENNVSQENISALATALRCNDAVKFAKYIPPNTESEDCLIKIKETINLIETSKQLNP